MARTAVAVTALTANDKTAVPTATSLDPTNGHSVAGAFAKNEHILLYVAHSTASSKVLTIKAGAKPPAERSDLGDLAITLSASTTYVIGPLEAARFAQADGSLNIDVAASATGTIGCVRAPHSI